MHQFVQSAIEAANQGDTNKAMDFIKQVLAADENDVDAWLVLAAIVDEPNHKRQCLNRVLALDPNNQLAQEEMLELDRAAMGDMPAYMPDLAPVSPFVPQSLEPPTEPAQHKNGQDLNQKSAPKTKPLIFQTPLVLRLTLYTITVLALTMSFIAIFNFKIGAFLLLFVVFMGLCFASWYYSIQVKISNKGILVDTHVMQSHTSWDNISAIKTDKQSLELKRKKGRPVKIMGVVSGYQTIVETLREKRPDLFENLE